MRFPFSDVKEAKLRPVLVLTRPNPQGDFIGAQITSQLHHIPQLRLSDSDFALGRLPKPSVLRPDKLFTLNKDLVVRRVGRLNHPGFVRALAAICECLGCPNDEISNEGPQ
ncbi:type II toxin-antitoxin system PemK/MazF family toxin [Thioflavicoccus mobilis]|uniref:type II toxin-antitoxin system PemK/MazF family toxin n=1 Tax=Thioflavicoccus mobilis TaxID=80679 RepID=UPI0012FBBB47|nr:type II toxin-antitoxin system PemK/MazF family toxin [Thioflavicoccus mobilis]